MAKSTLRWPQRYEQLLQTAQNPLLKDFYQQAFTNQDTALKDVPFVALDFETTGLDANSDDIVSVGLVPFNVNRIYCKDSRHWVVQPRRDL
ncbi:MAG: 3'-5' exonuclease, partial [Pseudomonadota bacterium]